MPFAGALQYSFCRATEPIVSNSLCFKAFLSEDYQKASEAAGQPKSDEVSIAFKVEKEKVGMVQKVSQKIHLIEFIVVQCAFVSGIVGAAKCFSFFNVPAMLRNRCLLTGTGQRLPSTNPIRH